MPVAKLRAEGNGTLPTAPCLRLSPKPHAPLQVERALNWAITRGGALATVPMPHCTFEHRKLNGAVHVLKPEGEPGESAWPLDLQYATGLTAVELERRLRNSTYMSIEFIQSEEFSKAAADAIRKLSMPYGTPPGGGEC